MTPKEFRSTTVMSLPLSEVSAKVRTGPPNDDEEDYALPYSGQGVLPVRMDLGLPSPIRQPPEGLRTANPCDGFQDWIACLAPDIGTYFLQTLVRA